MGHLGHRVSALLDGQLPDAEAERAWSHVHACHVCRDLVEREGWLKTRLSGLQDVAGSAPDHLKGSLCRGAATPALAPTSGFSPTADEDRPRRAAVVMLGGSAAGVAVLGVLALGLGPGSSAPDRQAPVTNVGGSDAGRSFPVRVPGELLRQTSPSPRP